MSTTSFRTPEGLVVLNSPSPLPDVLDLLIVGGGPMGTACAFRAKELGLAALVIDMDDLMKRIRDYAKDKPILPDYGGGDTMAFPAGGELVAALRFEPIDKDQMVELWKGLYRKFSVPAKVGIELLGLDRQQDGVWRAECRNHYTKQPEIYHARQVVLALGRGVPRRLDIPGNVQDLALRFVSAEQYIGAPACVIGGGTSAAEAVIAISNAKAQSDTDETAVYWSYRGLFMPKVSQALAPDLFDAMMINGNLRFVLGSDPVGVITNDGHEYLAIRTEVTELPGGPRQVVQLEFPKAYCVACIGADRPDPLLRSLGVEFVPKESGEGDRLVVSPLLESRRPGLYVAGDLLSPDYAETMSFEDDPSTFTIRPRRGNIKAALRDGVLLAEVVKQRLEGREDIRVVLEPAPPVASPTPKVDPTREYRKEPLPEPPPPPASPGRLISLLADGTPADEFPLVAQGVTTVGRQGATVAFPQDTMLSDQHAAITHGTNGLEVRDLGSQHGVFLKVAEGRVIPLESGTIVKAGRQWLVPETSAGRWAAVIHYDAAGREVARHAIAENTTMVLGRAAPATVLDGADSTLSRRHVSLSAERGRLLLRDLGSRNGTFVKIEGSWPLQDGDVLWLGNQVLRVSIGDGKVAAPALVQGKASTGLTALPKPPVPAPGSTEPSVTFGPGKTYPFGKSGTLLDLALAKRVRIKYECKVGDCGKCRVDVTAGAQYLDPRTPQEDKALRMIGHDEPECRLACLVTRVTGPVSVQVPK
jgi:thioredoxin reductase/ferredoxin/pSer/pThr/pTyr-binding forkhead associated (FHA) protein